jgi:hypothetical protein
MITNAGGTITLFAALEVAAGKVTDVAIHDIAIKNLSSS